MAVQTQTVPCGCLSGRIKLNQLVGVKHDHACPFYSAESDQQNVEDFLRPATRMPGSRTGNRRIFRPTGGFGWTYATEYDA